PGRCPTSDLRRAGGLRLRSGSTSPVNLASVHGILGCFFNARGTARSQTGCVQSQTYERSSLLIHQSETLMHSDAERLEGGKMRTVLRRPGPEVGGSLREILPVALAVVTVAAVIASGAVDTFLHGGDRVPTARVAAAGTGAPAVAEAAGGAPVADSGILSALRPAAAVAPAGVHTVGPGPEAAARPAE